MLEQQLRSLLFNKKAILWSGVAGLVAGTAFAIISDVELSVQACLILSLVWVAFIGWNYLTTHIKIKLLTNYLTSLQSGAMDEALNYGRSYYSVKRGGISGHGELTVYDEAAINNDINAYSRAHY